MSDLNLDLPPGVVSNGTKFSRRGNWIDASRVRWHNNAIRPIGGWGEFPTNVGPLDPVIATPLTEVARSTHAWQANDGSGLWVAGTNLGLKAWYRGATTVYNITPLDFTPRPRETAENTGYGAWFYGLDSYGTERQGDELDVIPAFSWAFGNWGQNLLAAPRGAPSALYEWVPTFGSPAQIVANAPIDFDCFVVTDERIVMCAGTPAEPRLIQWSTREDNTVWNIAPENQAGFQNLPGFGRFRAIVPVQDEYLFVSDTDAFKCRYIGPPYVFSFDSAGKNCGTMAAMAVVSADVFAVWPGRNAFYMYDGASVKELECPVLERFLKSINSAQVSKTVGFVNPGWSEVWWLYQEGTEDLDSYIYYNWVMNHWGIGKLERTCAGGNLAMGGLYMIGNDGLAYRHEQEGVAPIDFSMSEVFIESGPITMDGGMPQYMSFLVPDYICEGTVAVSFISQDRPQAAEQIYGPYIINYSELLPNQPVPIRVRGHMVRYRIEGVSELWAQGSVGLQYANGARRRK